MLKNSDKDASNFIYGNCNELHHSRLGWEFYVFKKCDTETNGLYRFGLRFLARWGAGLGGDKWINELVSSGKASAQHRDLMRTFVLSASVMQDVLRNGIPKHTGPAVIGEDYFLPTNWISNAQIDWQTLESLDSSELLIVDMVDQS